MDAMRGISGVIKLPGPFLGETSMEMWVLLRRIWPSRSQCKGLSGIPIWTSVWVDVDFNKESRCEWCEMRKPGYLAWKGGGSSIELEWQGGLGYKGTTTVARRFLIHIVNLLQHLFCGIVLNFSELS